MKLYTQRLDHTHKTNIHKDNVPKLALTFDVRQKSRFRAELANGEAVGVDLPRTEVLRSGAIIATDDGEELKIVAAPQTVMQVTANSTIDTANFDLMRAAYHLGNRHVPLMLTIDALYFEPDHVLQDMLLGLGVQVETVKHPFEPEIGAYSKRGGDGEHSHGHHHSHGHTHSHSISHGHHHH